jgi:Protein of unknown function (DUF1264)
MIAALSVMAATGLGWWRRIHRNTGPSMSLPGEPEHLDTRLYELGASLLQDKAPLAAMRLYFNDFHLMQADQVEVHCYCAWLNEDLAQCVIFDGNTRDAHLVGVEYLISERSFAALPAAEQRLWHSHRHDVDAGLLAAPGIPGPLQQRLKEKLGRTYGKGWRTWDTERDALPTGAPRPMSALSPDVPVRCSLLEDRDQRFGLSSAAPAQRVAR